MSKKLPEKDECVETTGKILASGRAAELMQTRFTRIPDAHLNSETVAGVRDMKLGRIKHGEPVGAPTIRFDAGNKPGVNPHINIDPKGVRNAANPHIEVSSGVVTTAKVANTVIKYTGITLTVAAVVIDVWRIGSALKDDCYTRDHADEIIEELEEAITALKTRLKEETKSAARKEIKETIEQLELILRDVRRTKKWPVKYTKTISSVAGGWGGGAAGGAAGAWGGAQTGAMVGSLFGPVGTVVGAPIGAVVGAIGAGILGGMAGSAAGEELADQALKLAD